LQEFKTYLIKTKKLTKQQSDGAINKFATAASNHPLITKLARASVYIALEGANPISSAKALGANRWSDFKILLEPTIVIPLICSQLYTGYVNRFFDNSVKAIQRALKLDAKLYIPFFYINECAGHLLRARKYEGLVLNEDELIYSENAFISNYFSLKKQGTQLPNGILNYLRTFSPAILTERADTKAWVRTIMTDIQSILSKASVEFAEVPFYENGQCAQFEKDYMHAVLRYRLDKPTNLINHDIYALQFTHDKIVHNKDHWIILTYDKSMIEIPKLGNYSGWITNPPNFLDLSEEATPLSETEYVSLLHIVASYSEKTLSAGSRIIDRVVHYASHEMQNWQFQHDIDEFKKEILNDIDLNSNNAYIEIDSRTDEFLKLKGVNMHKMQEDDVDL
jgi:hypothetical protein